jgi:hypothetical protein
MIAASVSLGLARHDSWPLLIAACGAVYLFTTWVLSPYSKFAARTRLPDPPEVDRWMARADRVRRLPIIGRIFRFCEELSGHAGERMSLEYKEFFVREHERLKQADEASDPKP